MSPSEEKKEKKPFHGSKFARVIPADQYDPPKKEPSKKDLARAAGLYKRLLQRHRRKF